MERDRQHQHRRRCSDQCVARLHGAAHRIPNSESATPIGAHKFLTHNGALTPTAAAARWQARADEIDAAVVAESARWGDAKRTVPFTRDVEWQAELNRLMTNYFPVRTDVLLQQLTSAGLYPTVEAPN